VAEDEDFVAECSFGTPRALDETRLRGRRQLTGTLDAPLGGELATLTQDEHGQRGGAWLFRCGAHSLIVCRLKSHS